MPSYLRRLLHRERAAFGYAWQGLRGALREEVHFRVHIVATLTVLFLGALVPLTRADWALLTLATGAVWVAELFNTAIERLTDLASPGLHPLAGQAKDVAAAAVMLMAATAAVVGALILGPPLWELMAE